MVFAADDNFAVKDFDEAWIRNLRYLTDNPFGIPPAAGWPLDTYFTMCKLQDLDLPQRNWTTHLPCWFDFDKLIDMLDRFEMDKQSYNLEDLYFNLYHGNDEAELDAPYKFFLSQENDWMDLDAAMKQRMWICNTVEGWSEEMEKKLMCYYNL